MKDICLSSHIVLNDSVNFFIHFFPLALTAYELTYFGTQISQHYHEI